MKKILGVLLTSTVLTTAALANGAPAPAPAACPACPAAAAADHTGFKLGLNLGLGHGSNKTTANGISDTEDGTNTPYGVNHSKDFSSKGLIAGLHAGYDKQLSKNFLLGAEVSFDFSGIKGRNFDRNTAPAVGDNPPVVQISDDRFSQSWTLATVARAGLVHENSVFYGLAGWVATKSTMKTLDERDRKKTLNGIRVGMGASHKMGKIVLGVEATYDMFGKHTKRIVGASPNVDNYTVAVKPNILAGKVKIAYAF